MHARLRRLADRIVFPQPLKDQVPHFLRRCTSVIIPAIMSERCNLYSMYI